MRAQLKVGPKVRGKNPPTRQLAGTRLRDSQLVVAATAAIRSLPMVPQPSIKVKALNGWIYLEGKVNWRHQRSILEDVIRPLPGVRGVSDSIIIEAVLQ